MIIDNTTKSIGPEFMNNVIDRELERVVNPDSISLERQNEGVPITMNINSNSPKKMISFKSVDKLRSSSKHSGKSSGKKKNREVSNDYEDEGRLN